MAANNPGVEDAEFNDKVVISGISGLFPSSNNVNEFMHNLYNKVDMVTSDNPRWNLKDPSIPKHIGLVEGFDKFDAQFFKVTYQLGYVVDPMARKLLEEAYGAIFDSGTSLASLKSKKIGVFIGSSFSDSSAMIIYQNSKFGNFIINGSSKAMFANRISYWIDGRGPSFGLDYSCTSSAACLEIAYSRMKAGDCDAAIVGGCNFCLYPNLSKNMRCADLLCLDGKTKCFDKNADGYVRSDAVSLLFLQKAKDAKRIYAEIVNIKGEHKIRPDAGFLPIRKPDDLENFLSKFYTEANIDPGIVEYVEANAAAIAQADRNEMEAISNVFAKDKVIKIGSVKSNMGNSEPASGVTALTKLCLAYQQGKLPGNLHYNEPQNIQAIRENKIQVVTDNEDFKRGYTALNNFSFTGANYHVLLKGHYKKKDPTKYQNAIPQLVLASGRQEDCASKIFDVLKSQPLDIEQIALLRNAFADDILGHTARGYAILDTNENNETVCLSESVDYYPGVKPPVWFVYSGMGSQWAGMGADLMRIPIFAEAIRKCSKVLESKGIDLIKVLTEPDNTIFDNIVNGFVGIGAVQIGLTDILKAMGIVPDYIIGHSLGETACAYCDGAFTAEEMILCTHCRGETSKEIHMKGTMAVVGVGYKTVVKQCPPDIDVACHNSAESATLSGPMESMKKFISELTARGIFAREVPCANVPYHSRYVAEAGTLLLKKLKDIIKDPKPRSKRWLPTSIPQSRWDEPIAKYSSAEYQTNNLVSPVLFEETAKFIPDNAIVIEIAPHGLLQAILKRSHKDCTHIPLTKRGVRDGVKFLMEAIGKMYQAGLNPKVDALYPKIEYPVSTETPLLSHFVAWEHSEDWPIRTISKLKKTTASSRTFVMSVFDDDYKYLSGYVREGVNIFPESAILVLVWETLAMHRDMDYRNLSVVFKDIHFLSEVAIKQDRSLKFSVMIKRGDSKFEVCHDDTLIASGIVSGVKVINFLKDFEEIEKEDEIILNSEDVYKVFESRGFSYGGPFKSIHSSAIECNKARVKWGHEWVTFLDSLIQLNTLARDCEGVSVPKYIRKLSISLLKQEVARQNLQEKEYYDAYFNRVQGITRCAGVEIDSITFTDKPVFETECDVLETRSFFPYYSINKIDLRTSLHILLQIVAENAYTKDIKMIEIGTITKSAIINTIKEVADKVPLEVEVETKPVDFGELINIRQSRDTKTHVFVIENLFENVQKLNSIKDTPKETFILAIEQSVPNIQQNVKEHFTIITSLSDGKQILILLKRAHLEKETAYIRIGSDSKFSWLPRVYCELRTTKRVVLISERQPYCGVLGFVQKLRRDGANKLSAIIIEDYHAPTFNPENNVYKDQLEKNLGISIMKNGQWGSYYFTPSPKSVSLRNAILTKTAANIKDGLTWIESPVLPATNNLVQVSFAGISLRDSEKAVSNVNTKDTTFGMDFSGIDISGDRVMGIVRGSVSSSIQADPDLLWPVPDHWSLEDAATVPLPYVLAYYCLGMRGQIYKGQRVLVTGGAGALGQAVIAICLEMDCTIFTTVSTRDKKSFLLRVFPGLKEHHVGYSGDNSFHNMVAVYTKNKLCDIVINCSTGLIRETAMKCVGNFGLFLDLSKYDMYENKNIGMGYLSNDRNYRAVDLSSIFKPENAAEKKILQRMLSAGIANGTVRPLTRVIYSPNEVSRAFRLLSATKHRGKVLIRMRDPITTNQGMPVIPRITFSDKGAYIVVNDDTCLGIELVDRLVKRGVRKIVIHTRSRPVSGCVQTKFVSWMRQNVEIKLSSENLQTEEGCMKMIKDVTKIGQVQGIFIVQHSDDFVSDNLDQESSDDFIQKLTKFSVVVMNLDVVSRRLCSEVRHFVILSRCSQNDSHEFAASIAERICRARNDVGYPALVLRYNVLHPENKFIGSHDKLLPTPRSALFDAMEKSLKLKHKYVRTFNLKNTKRLDFERDIYNILGVKNIDANKTKTLEELNINKIHLEEIKTVIRKTYPIDYHVEKIQTMTIETLLNIGKDNIDKITGVKTGPGVFYSYIEIEEDLILGSPPVVPMITLLNDGTEIDLDPHETYLTMIPGFEGRPEIFTSISERLKIQAVTVPLGPDVVHDSITEMAAEVRKAMKTKFETKTKFYLLGYSFGVNVALELANLLEKEGHEGIVYCLDSSPDALRHQINVYLGNITQAQLQNIVIEHAYFLMTGLQIAKHELDSIQTWTEKVEYCITKLKGLVNYSQQYKRAILESMYQRFRLAQEYKPTFKLRSEVVLIKSVQSQGVLVEDYGLSNYTQKEVRVYTIDSDHISTPRDPRVSNIINRLLDPALLEDFKKKNLCDTYFVEE